MSIKQLTTEAMTLPLSDRVALAETLWESINADLAITEPEAASEEALRRDEELSNGKAVGISHEEVMKAARKAIECA